MSSPNQLSFLPDDYLELKAQQRTNAICAVLFALLVVGIGTAFHFTEKQMRVVEAEYAEITTQYVKESKPIEKFRKFVIEMTLNPEAEVKRTEPKKFAKLVDLDKK